MGKGSNSFEIRLRNAGGVPVLQLGGYITETAVRAIRFTLDRLAGAGHYNVVLNIERATAPSWRFLTGLADPIGKIREHYGSVELVATREKLQQLLGVDQVARLFRLSASEGQAISRIKGLIRAPESTQDISARLK